MSVSRSSRARDVVLAALLALVAGACAASPTAPPPARLQAAHTTTANECSGWVIINGVPVCQP